MSMPIRRQNAQAAAGYNGTVNVTQPQAATTPAKTSQPQQTTSTNKNQAAQSSFTTYNKDASKASLGKQKATKKDSTQDIADKAIELFGAGTGLSLTAIQFSETMRKLTEHGILNKKVSKALHEVFDLVKTGTSKSAIRAKLSALRADFGVAGKIFSVLSGVLSIANNFQKGNYKGVFKDIYAIAAAFSTLNPVIGAYDAVLSVMRVVIPKFKGSIPDKALSSINLMEYGKIGIDAIAETIKQISNLVKYKRLDLKSLDKLVTDMSKGGAAFLVKFGENIGEAMYDVMGNVSKEFTELWLVLNDPNTRITPSDSGKISAVMNKLCEQMNSPNPTIRKQATKMAKETLQKLIARSKTDPQCRKGLSTWYGYVKSTGSQGYGKYRALLKQSPDQMQSIHTQWRNNSSWYVRLFLSKQAPQVN